MSQVIEVNDGNFEVQVISSQRPVLVDFSATWCGPCKRLAPIVAELAEEYAGRVDIVHIDIDEARETAARFGVMSVPTLMFFRQGEVTDQITGLMSKDALSRRLEKLLA